MARSVTSVRAVVVGASAGGIEALSLVLRAVPASFPAAIIIVQHLGRGRLSVLAEIFAAKCALPLSEAFDKQPIESGQVYLAPPDYHVLVDRGPQLSLSIDPPVHYSRPSIDVLFESAAEVYRTQLMGVVLTGANADGAEGLEAIRRNGGITVVQDPETALYPTMPTAALALGAPNYVLSLEALCELIHKVGEAEPSRSLKVENE